MPCEVMPLSDYTEEDMEKALQRISEFIRIEAPQLAQLFGIRQLSIEVGDGWATNLETGLITIDPKFFLERGYTPDMAVYGMCHEVAAHLREVLTEPELTHEVAKFCNPPTKQIEIHPGLKEARSIFHNIFSDVAGNNAIHQLLPTMSYVARDIYQTKLFADSDYTNLPRHLQFLYKFIREEMIEGSETNVAPEVDELLAEFRDFKGLGDLLKHSTSTSISAREAMSPQERFRLWTEVIYPRWLDLFTADEADERFQKKPSEQSPGDGKNQNGQPGSPTKTPDFEKEHDEYRKKHHPEPLSDNEHKQIERDANTQVSRKRRNERKRERESSASYQRDAELRRETGHGLTELQNYNKEIERYHEQIDRLRTIFRKLLNEHIGAKKRLRGGHTEGATLDPDRLAQTYIDLDNNMLEPPAFVDYEKQVSERELTGRTDYHVVFDRSGSMQGDRSIAAASAGVISLEAISGMQRDIETMQFELGVDVDVDIRSAIYTFNDTISNPKPLSRGISLKERLDTYAEIRDAGGGNADSHILATIDKLPIEHDRQQILIVVCDGEADDKVLSRKHIEHLRTNGWRVYGISIDSDAAVELYAPHSERIDDPALLPETLERLIGETL